MNKEEFYIKTLQPIREFCSHSDKEDVYMYIYELQQQNKKYKEVIDKLKEDLNLIIEYGNGEDASRYDKQYGEFAKNHLKFMDKLLKEVE